jgi:hypothetical protein
MDILITRHLTLRPLLEVDADDIRELITNEPALMAKLPRAMIALIGSDDRSGSIFSPQTLVVIREKLIGWISLDEVEATGFASGYDSFTAEAIAAALAYFAQVPTELRGSSSHQLQSSQFAA